ncbi:MAG: DUF1512 family protein [Candidatus Aenigmarchaeota archaeon]|nr:DUF1512 family protein [Candidatus Aenigmarchaeota archaeon]
MSVLAQLGLDGNPFSFLVSLFFLVVFFLFYPRIMLMQIMWKLEKTVQDLERLDEEGKKVVLGEISKKPDKKTTDAVNRFFEFFMITPVDLDPYGVVRKVEHLVNGQRHRFRSFVRQVAPDLPEEKQANIEMGLAGGISLHEISKIVKHYVEVVKKTKSFQIAMILQMQLPLIERMSKSLFKGTKALARGHPIGDAAGPYMVARMIGKAKVRDVGDDIILARKDLDGKELFLLKSKGPGGRLGRPGYVIDKLARQYRFSKIVSIDAAAKLEGERTGSVAEGVGVAMGGIGVERSYIEGVAVKNDIPLDSIIVKMSGEEAIEPLRKVITDAYPLVMESLERSLAEVKRGERVLVIGVGNTSGIGNDGRGIKDAEDFAERMEREYQARKKKEA